MVDASTPAELPSCQRTVVEVKNKIKRQKADYHQERRRRNRSGAGGGSKSGDVHKKHKADTGGMHSLSKLQQQNCANFPDSLFRKHCAIVIFKISNHSTHPNDFKYDNDLQLSSILL